MPHVRRPLVVFVTAICLLRPQILLAQTDAPAGDAEVSEDVAARAREAFRAGQQAFAGGRFEEAAKAFEEAYRIKPHASPLVNAGEAWERAEQPLLAARTYQRVLEMEQVGERDRADATERLARLAAELGVIVLEGEEGVRARIDDEEFAAGSRVYVLPGRHRVTLVGTPGSRAGALEVEANSEHTVDLARLRPKSSGASAKRPEPFEKDREPKSASRRGISAVTFIAYGAGAAALLGAGYFGLRANSAADEFDAKFARGEPNRDEYDRFNQRKLFANIGLGVGVVGVSLGTYFLWRDLEQSAGAPAEAQKPQNRRGLGVALVPSAGGVLLAAGSRY